jgi:hypothetical protein
MKAKVSISRSSDDTVRIRIRDEASGIEFAEVSLTVEAYGYLITGLSDQEADLQVRNLQFVGKTRISEQRQIECPLSTYDKSELSQWLKENAQEEGWIVSTYLGSQSSVTWNNGKATLRYSVTKYVDSAPCISE